MRSAAHPTMLSPHGVRTNWHPFSTIFETASNSDPVLTLIGTLFVSRIGTIWG